jgi:hypothetical protein
VVLAKSVYQPSATVDRWRKSFFVLIAVMRKRANERTLSKATNLLWKAGRACSSAGIFANASSTVECTSVRRSATLRRRKHHIARDRQTLLHTVHVVRRHLRISRMQQERHAKTIFQAVHSHAGRRCHAVIHASKFAIPEAAVTASRPSSFSADVAVPRRSPSATRVRPRRHSACAFAGPR